MQFMTSHESVLLWDFMTDSNEMDKAFMQFMTGNESVLLWDLMTD